MNGELHHACRITAAIKHALAGSLFAYEKSPYEETEHFIFENGETACCSELWFQKLNSQGLTDAVLFTPDVIRDRNRLAFANGAQVSIVCFYKNGEAAAWSPRWEYIDTARSWKIEYRESVLTAGAVRKPEFADPTPEFRKVLLEIKELAEQIEEPGFAACFDGAADVLTGKKEAGVLPIDLPEHNRCLFAAAEKAWVFGGMCSWNDSPPYEASEKGLGNEYERLSAELLRQIMLAVLFAVNGWK